MLYKNGGLFWVSPPFFFTIVHLLEVDESKNWFRNKYKEDG